MAAIPNKRSFLSLDSVTRVREAGAVFSGPLANDLQKIMQEINDLHRAIGALQTADVTPTPVPPSTLSDFLLPEPPTVDNGALDLITAVLALQPAVIPADDGALDLALAAYLAQSGNSQTAALPAIISDTYANIASYDPTLYASPTLYWVTDRKVLYIDAAATAWVYAAGTMIDVAANRPLAGGLGANDAGFLFLASDTLAQSYWSGAAWVPYAGATGSTGAWTPTVSFAGGSAGLTYTSQSGEYFRISTLVVATFDVILSSKGVSVGFAEIGGLPVNLSALEVTGGSIQYCDNMLGLTSVPSILPEIGTTRVSLFQTGAAGSTALTDVNFTNTTRLIGTAIYST